MTLLRELLNIAKAFAAIAFVALAVGFGATLGVKAALMGGAANITIAVDVKP